MSKRPVKSSRGRAEVKQKVASKDGPVLHIPGEADEICSVGDPADPARLDYSQSFSQCLSKEPAEL